MPAPRASPASAVPLPLRSLETVPVTVASIGPSRYWFPVEEAEVRRNESVSASTFAIVPPVPAIAFVER